MPRPLFLPPLVGLLLAPLGALAQDPISREDLLAISPVLATIHRFTPTLTALQERDGQGVVYLDMVSFLAAAGAVSRGEPLTPEAVVAAARTGSPDQAVGASMHAFRCGDPFTVSLRALESTEGGMRVRVQIRAMNPARTVGDRIVASAGMGEYLADVERTDEGWKLVSVVPSGREIGPQFFSEGCGSPLNRTPPRSRESGGPR